ncbi:MAG: hypothetical protein KatS3mg010_2123 [Acidimicrobiia bacterium]|nr:MAG: hypothetical protein KatS3mg010_2123 [Acidimicrobiia bacterium]
MYGTKDRSWGVRPVGEPAGAAPELTPPQIFFLWAPINFEDRCSHFLCFERANGDRWVGSQALLDVIGPTDATWGADDRVEHLAGAVHEVRWARGLRRCEGASLRLLRHDGGEERIELEPLLTFRMRGLGYTHPTWGHARWHGEEVVGSEEHRVEELDNLEPWNIHVQQVMRARWGDRTGLGVPRAARVRRAPPERPHRLPRRRPLTPGPPQTGGGRSTPSSVTDDEPPEHLADRLGPGAPAGLAATFGPAPVA